MPVTGVFIEKICPSMKNWKKCECQPPSLLSGRRDILVVASVSCLYGIGNPIEFQKNLIPIEKGQIISRTKLLHQLVQSLYSRTEADFNPGSFRIKETLLMCILVMQMKPTIHFFGDEIEEIESFDTKNSQVLENLKDLLFIPLICL
jgi:excinuclease ABC subunit B